MRSLLVRVLLFLAAGFLATPSAGIAQHESPVQGAWLLTGSESADGTAASSILPALVLYTSTHYSVMYARGNEARADLSDEPTDEELVTAYNSFVANSGRYEIDGDQITTRAFVAKNPNYMHGWPDNAQSTAFAVDGDQLVLTYENGLKVTFRSVEGMQMPDDE
jgi:hypothetical protein